MADCAPVPTSGVRRPRTRWNRDPSRTRSKKTHTQRHGTLVVFTQVSSGIQFSQLMTRETRTPGWVKEARIPDSDEKNLSHDGLRRSRSFGIPPSQRLEEIQQQTIQNKRPQHCRGGVGTSTPAVACVFASQPQPLLSVHIRPCCRTATKTSSLTVQMTSSATICSRVRRFCSSGAPRKPLQATSPLPHSSRN